MITLIIIIVNQVATRYPEYAKKKIKGAMYKQVESVMSNAEFEEHFSPPYNVRKLQGPTKSFCQSVYIFATISHYHLQTTGGPRIARILGSKTIVLLEKSC